MLVPAFAVGRAQQVIYMLLELFRRGRLPKVPVHLDSPMAVEASRIYLRHADELDRLDGETIDAEYLQAMGVTAHRTRDDSKRLNDMGGPRVIVSSSGMLTGGRVLHHLAQRLPDPRNTILFVGYQAAGTRGRALSEGAPYIRLHGMEVEARAEVVVMHGLSGHADAPELLRWTSALQTPRDVFVTHGEPDAAAALAEILRRDKGWNTRVPALHESFEL